MKRYNRLVPKARFLFIASLLAGLFTGCAVVGQVRPVEEKSQSYGVLELNKENPEWLKLDQSRADSADDMTGTEVPDAAYQSKKSGAIISINSACRAGLEQDKDLQNLTNLLFLGVSDIKTRTEQGITIETTPALQTTLHGTLNGEEMMFRTVVMKRGVCVYDMIYMASPQFFPDHEQEFAHFVASLRVK